MAVVFSRPAAATTSTPCPPPTGPQARVIALPALKPHYVIPQSNNLDPPYSWKVSPTWPFPRAPWPYETETRAAGTGLIWGAGTTTPPATTGCCPPPPPPGSMSGCP